MPESLWKIRETKGMTVAELAAKSGVPAISITEYESGQSIRSADLPKLAKALYVEEWDIEIKGEPRPPDAGQSAATPPPRQSEHVETAAPRTPRAPRPARATQIEHLLTLAQHHFAADRAALEEELGKQLEDLTQREASQLLKQYQQKLADSRSELQSDAPASKRKRAYLPEGVDQFELEYLTSQQETGTVLRFALFNGQEVSGSIVGFSPYSITIREAETGDELTIQKLAIAFYRATTSTPGGD
jgi:transcriptional regulator with XRE-family HTH domain